MVTARSVRLAGQLTVWGRELKIMIVGQIVEEMEPKKANRLMGRLVCNVKILKFTDGEREIES